MKIPLHEQIAEVAREVALRRNVYPRLIALEELRHAEAALHLARMRAALASLRSLRRIASPFRPRSVSRRKRGEGRGEGRYGHKRARR